MHKPILSIAIAAAMLVSGQVSAADAEAGKAKSGVCAGCHGVDGNAAIPMYPSLAGQWEDYLLHALQEYKSGVRKDPVMGAMVASLTQVDLENLAAYFASQKGNLSHTPLD